MACSREKFTFTFTITPISGGGSSVLLTKRYSGDQIKKMRWVGHVAVMVDRRGAYRVLVGRSEGERPLGRPRRRWEDNIKMALQEVGWEDMDWIDVAQDRDRWRALVIAVMNLRVP
jgi:hypothetical protein